METETDIDLDPSVDANLDAIDADAQTDAELAIDDAQEAYDGPLGAEIEGIVMQMHAILAGYDHPAGLADLTTQLRDYLIEHAHQIASQPMYCLGCGRDRQTPCWRLNCSLLP